MVKADDSGGGGHHASTTLFRVNQTLERLNSSKHPVEHPAVFLLERMRTIELWRSSGKRLNLLQLGTSLVRGVLCRGHQGRHPLRLFDPVDEPSLLHPTSSHIAAISRDSAAKEGAHEGKNKVGEWHLPAQSTHSAFSSERVGATTYHRHMHHNGSTTMPSVALIVFVQAASEISAELYMGVLVGFFSHGVSSMAEREEVKLLASSSSSLTATPDQSALPTHSTDAAAASPESLEASTNTMRSSDKANTTPAFEGEVEHYTTSTAGIEGAEKYAPRQRLSSEAAHALHEVHRAAREIIQIMYADVKKLNMLFSQTAPDQACLVPHEDLTPSEVETSQQSMPHDAPHAELPPEVQAHDLCLRLTHLSANLYSLIAFLDFFSVERELAEKMAMMHTSPSTAAAEPQRLLKGTEKTSKSFALCFSSPMAALASATVDHGSQAAGLAVDYPKHAGSTTGTDVKRLHSRGDGGGAAAEKSCDTSPKSTTTAVETGVASSFSAHHVKSAYTVELFNGLFDVAGHLPRCIWDMLAAATAALSQCDVSWSLTRGDASKASNFNATAAVIFSDAQLSLLRQLHRLCRRFEVLRQHVYGLYPVSPMRFKVKQILDWNGFLHGDDRTLRSTHDSYADVIDFHDDALHATFSLRARWAVTAANRRSILLVAATPYVPPVLKVCKEEQEVASASSSLTPAGKHLTPASVPNPCGSSSDSYASKVPVSSLLATLASVGTSSYSSLHSGDRYSTFNNRRSTPGPLTNDHKNNNSNSSHATFTKHSAGKLSTVNGWVGLRNSGNTCFLNSVVQLLSSATLFRDDLLLRVQQAVFHSTSTPSHHADHFGASKPGTSDASKDSSKAALVNATATVTTAAGKAPDLAEVFKKYGCRLAMVLLLGELQWRAQHHYEAHPVLPDYLDSQLPASFSDHRQHDASEFLHALLDQLNAPAQPGGAVVARWFSGTTATTMTCTRCRHARTHVNAFWDVSTPILRTPSPSTASNRSNLTGDSSIGTSAEQYLAKQSMGGQVVEVVRFPGATATTTSSVNPAFNGNTAVPIPTVLSAGATSRALGVADNDEEAGQQTAPKDDSTDTRSYAGSASPLVSLLETVPSAAAQTSNMNHDAHRRAQTLQHLLLHVLHPTLNKELLYGGNALDCEYCGRRANTSLTTQLVAEVNAERNNEDIVSAQSPSGRTPDQVTLSSSATGPVLSGRTEADGAGLRNLQEKNVAAGGAGVLSEAERRNSREEETTLSQSHYQHDAVSSLFFPVDNVPGDGNGNSSTTTAAGGGLPWYLAVQLNRFAYQRTTQSFGKITDGVPLNEVVVVPAYPMHYTPAAPSPEQDNEAVNQTEGAPLAQHKTKEETHRASTAPPAAVPQQRSNGSATRIITPVPVWVAYRLKTILVHSGSSPNSGHYFALTRSTLHNTHKKNTSHPSNTNEEQEVSESPAEVVEADEEGATSVTVRAYVNKLGAAFTHALEADRFISAYSSADHCPLAHQNSDEQIVNEEVRASVAVKPAEEGNKESSTPEVESRKTVASAPPSFATLPQSDEKTATGNPAALEKRKKEAAVEDTEDSLAEARSPLLTPIPALPTAAVSVSGSAFYQNWVMLNDSNVQTVPADTMRRILRGDGGLYSALDTPYLMLYEKIPVCYVDGRYRGSKNNSSTQNEESHDAGGRSLGTEQAHALQRAWEHQRAEVICPRSRSTSAVELAPEVTSVFQARLNEEQARVHSSNTATTGAAAHMTPSHNTVSSSVPSPVATAAAGTIKSYELKSDQGASNSAAVYNSTVTTFAGTKTPTTTGTSTPRTRNKVFQPIATSGAALRSSKRLRAKAAAYAQQQMHCSKEHVSCRRLIHGAATVHSDLNAIEDAEARREKEEDGDSDSDDCVSLD